MIIKKNSNGSRAFKDFLVYFKFIKKIKFLLLFFIIGFACLSMVSYGIYLNRNKKIDNIVHFGADLSQTKFNSLRNYFSSYSSNPDQIIIDVKFKHVDRINELITAANTAGFITEDLKTHEFPAKITLSGKKYKVKLSLTGQYLDHIESDRNSFNVEVKDGMTIMGMSKFKLLIPNTRGYLADWVAHRMQQREGLIVPRFDFVTVKINGESKGVFAVEESYNTDLIENNNLRDGIIFKPGLQQIEVLNKKKISKDINLQNRVLSLKNLWQSFLNGEIPPEKIFDLEKFAIDYVTTDLVSGLHSKFLLNLRYYYNPITNLIEPISREFGFMRNGYELIGREKTNLFIKALYEDSELSENDKKFHKKLFESIIFQRLYIKNLERVSSPSYLDSFFKSVELEMSEKERIIYKETPVYSYPKRFLYENQKIINSFLHPIDQMVSGDIWTDDTTWSSKFINHSFLPIRINYLLINDSIIQRPAKDEFIMPSFRNSLKKWPVSIDKGLISNLSFCCSVIGLENSVTCYQFSKVNDASPASNPTTMSRSIFGLDGITVDTINNDIRIHKGSYVWNETYLIPSDYNVNVEAGTNLEFGRTGGLISRSEVHLNGTKASPIVITSSDVSNTGIAIINAEGTSTFSYVEFSKLSNYSSNDWNLTGSITFYNSDIVMNNCVISSNRSGDDLLNIVRSYFEINNCRFNNSYADALDADFCDGKIKNTTFLNSGNDAIDISGSTLFIEDVVIDKCLDKALSAGERSIIRGTNIEILNSEIAVCSKDLSDITLANYYLENNRIGLTAFQKKSKFGPGLLKLSNGDIMGSSVRFLIESNSVCLVDDIEIYSNEDNVKDLFYGVKYGKSSR